MPGTHIDDLPDHTVQGIWEANRAGEIDVKDALDEMIVRSAEALADKGHWMWMFTSATEDASLWQDLHGDYWAVDFDSGEIWAWGTRDPSD